VNTTTAALEEPKGDLIDEISRIKEPVSMPDLQPPESPINLVEERLEVHSIAHKSNHFGRHIEMSAAEISFVADLSPMARRLTNLKASEEVALLSANTMGSTILPVDLYDAKFLMDSEL
jgi:hypothetical protein